MTKPAILAIGGAHVDRRGHLAGPLVAGASNPGEMREEIGGGAWNALRNAMRFGASGTIVSVRGGDLAGHAVAQAIDETGADDLSATFLDRRTPSYTAILDHEGELVTGFADMALYETAFLRALRRRKVSRAIGAADAVLCDANLPEQALAALARAVPPERLFAIAISPAKVGRLAPVLDRVGMLFMNLAEARVLCGEAAADADALIAALQRLGLRRGVITAGSAPVCAFADATRWFLKPPAARRIADVTGAGDALAGTMTVALLQGMDMPQALRYGMAAAVLTVESEGVVAGADAAEVAAFAEQMPHPTETADGYP